MRGYGSDGDLFSGGDGGAFTWEKDQELALVRHPSPLRGPSPTLISIEDMFTRPQSPSFVPGWLPDVYDMKREYDLGKAFEKPFEARHSAAKAATGLEAGRPLAGADSKTAQLVKPPPIATSVRKKNHNLVERRRRNNINDNIAELRTVVPTLTEAKPSKSTILKKTIEYVYDIQARETQHSHRMTLLHSEVARLASENQLLMSEVSRVRHTLGSAAGRVPGRGQHGSGAAPQLREPHQGQNSDVLSPLGHLAGSPMLRGGVPCLLPGYRGHAGEGGPSLASTIDRAAIAAYQHARHAALPGMGGHGHHPHPLLSGGHEVAGMLRNDGPPPQSVPFLSPRDNGHARTHVVLPPGHGGTQRDMFSHGDGGPHHEPSIVHGVLSDTHELRSATHHHGVAAHGGNPLDQHDPGGEFSTHHAHSPHLSTQHNVFAYSAHSLHHDEPSLHHDVAGHSLHHDEPSLHHDVAGHSLHHDVAGHSLHHDVAGHSLHHDGPGGNSPSPTGDFHQEEGQPPLKKARVDPQTTLLPEKAFPPA